MAHMLTRLQALALMGAAGISAAAALTGCAGDPSVTDKPSTSGDGASNALRDRMVMGISVDPDGLDPQRTAAAATFQIANNIYDPLIRVTPTGELVAGLATKWEMSPEGTSITFTLREGLVFSNGNPCDAAAVVASLKRLQAPESPRMTEYADYEFEAPDATTVIARSAAVNVAMATDFAYAWASIVDVTCADTLASKPVGTGPYVLESWTPQSKLVLVANPSYWGEAPKTPTIELRVLPEATTQASALRAGDVDLILAASEQVATFEGVPGLQTIEFAMNGVQLMAMNCTNPALADVRVRQAIVSAVDVDALIEAVWWGQGVHIGSHFPSMLKEYVDLSQTHPYDPDHAKALLKEAGYEGGLTLKMRLPESYPMYVSAGQVIADALGKVGITCKIEIVDWGTWLEEVYTGHAYDLTVVGHTGRLDPITLLARYASTSSENYFGYANPEVDALIEGYRGELDDAKRLEIVQDIQRILANDAPALYIQSPLMIYAATDKLHGFVLYPIDIHEFKDVWIEG